MSDTPANGPGKLDWIEPLKAMAIVGILLNHLAEEFGPYAWFTNPGDRWPALATRLAEFLPPGSSLPVRIVRLLGWLGDSAPGVFILLSGFGLMWASLARGAPERPADFWRRRLLRLMPLYIAMHFVVLGLAILVPGVNETFASPLTFLSLVGLRFTPGLFFHISPSWWFIWLILQLYLVFPLLDRQMRRWGVGTFLIVVLGFTLVSRAVGIWGPVPRYFWLTGLFGGTRLAEFGAGMALAAMLWNGRLLEPSGSSALGFGAPLYAAGLLASLFLPTVLISNLLVTLGMSALFYAAWRLSLQRQQLLSRATLYAGAASFPVFLLHQPPLQWTKAFLGHQPALRLVVAVGLLALSFPLSLWLERIVNRALRQGHGNEAKDPWPSWIGTAAAVACCCTVILLVMSAGSPRRSAVAAWLVAATMLVPLVGIIRQGALGLAGFRGAALTFTLIAGGLALFVLPEGYGAIALVAALGAALGTMWLSAERSPLRTLIAAGAGAALCAGLVESGLRRWWPLETSVWGELPALESHATRGYALRPGQTTRLHYNNYDYVLRTNSLGLPGPEVEARRAEGAFRVLITGDAFTMPEGLPYERSWPALLQARLSGCMPSRSPQVINAAVTGYGPNEELAQLRELVPVLLPDVVLMEWFVNELEEIREVPAERRIGIGLDASGISRRERPLRTSQIRARGDRLLMGLSERVTGQSSPRRNGLSLRRYFDRGSDLYADSTFSALSDTLRAVRLVANGHHADLGLVLVPAALAASAPGELGYLPLEWGGRVPDGADPRLPTSVLDSIAGAEGVAALDLSDTLRNHRPRPTYQRESWHWTSEGHAATAGAVSRWLWQNRWAPEECAR